MKPSDRRRRLLAMMWVNFRNKYRGLYSIEFTSAEWIDLWLANGLEAYNNRGKNVGSTAVKILVAPGEPVTIRDVELTTRTRELMRNPAPRALKPVRPVKPATETTEDFRSDTPMQQRINEIEKLPTRNYRVINLKTGKSAAFKRGVMD